MQAEFTLLQFVALALPAVAILLQAVIQNHDELDDTSMDYWTEIRFIQYSFYTLVLAGIIFMIPIFLKSDSFYIKLGIFVAGGAIFLLAPATWFGLRRGRYAISEYETPEQEATAKIKSYLPIIAIPIFVSSIIFFSTRYLNIVSETLGPAIINSANQISIVVVIVIILGLSGQVITTYLKFRQIKEEKEQWKIRTHREVQEVSEFIENYLNDFENQTDIRKKQNKADDLLKDWRELISEAPDSLNKQHREDAKNLLESIELVSDILRSLLRAHRKLRTRKRQKEKTLAKINKMRSDGSEYSVEEVSDMNKKIDEMEEEAEIERARIAELKEDLEDSVHELTKLTAEFEI